ncbi:MAG TPA: hypothetical protein PLX15_04875 [Candidatus Woesearchaeota archaeon]|nr:hypothetical protein [Candidatus Woesearchaeota archaeon]
MEEQEEKKLDLKDLDDVVNIKTYIVRNELMEILPGDPETEIYFEDEKVIIFRNKKDNLLWLGYQFEHETDLLEIEIHFDLAGKKKIQGSLNVHDMGNETQIMVSKDFPVRSFNVVTNVEYEIRILLNGFTYEPFEGLKIEKMIFKNHHQVSEPLIEEYEVGKTL